MNSPQQNFKKLDITDSNLVCVCFEVYTKVIPPEANKGSIRQLIKILLSFLSRSAWLLLSNKKDSLELAKFKVIVYQSLDELVYVFEGAVENFR